MADVQNCSGSCEGCTENCDYSGGATVTLNLDDGTIIECAVLTIFPARGKNYIALLPLNEEGKNEDGEVFLYRYNEVAGEPSLDNIEDDDEYDAASDGFDEWLDTQEFDELVTYEDETELGSF